MPKKEPENWWPGIQKAEPFRRGVVIDNPRNLQPSKHKVRDSGNCDCDQQLPLPMETAYLAPVLCPDCRGLGRLKKGKICRECQGKGVCPADPTGTNEVGTGDVSGEV